MTTLLLVSWIVACLAAAVWLGYRMKADDLEADRERIAAVCRWALDAERHISDINEIMRRAEWGDADRGIVKDLLDLGYGPGEAPEGAGDYE